MNDHHVEECRTAITVWEQRRQAERSYFVPAKHNIWQVLSRVNTLLVCLEYMQRKLRVDLSCCKVLDVGSADGYGLAPFLVANFSCKQLYGIDLFEERVAPGRNRLPGVAFSAGDATDMKIYGNEEFDIVCEQFTFCHVLDESVVARIAREMIRVTRRGKYIIVFDWIIGRRKLHYNGVPKSKIIRLFGVGEQTDLIRRFRGQLFPPLGRFLSKRIPFLYPLVQTVLPLAVGSKLTLLRRLC